MSMISAQIDELRRYADMEDGTFPLLASALRDAADTIWQLRDDLQQAHKRLADAEHDESMAWDRVRKAEAENAKLREERDHLLANSNPTAAELRRVRSAWKKDREENAKLRELCSALYEFAYDEYPDSAELNFADRMRKLRIEVEHD